METSQRPRKHLRPPADVGSHGSPPAEGFGAIQQHDTSIFRGHATMAVVLMFVLQLCGCRPSKADLVSFGLHANYSNNAKVQVLESGKEIILTGKPFQEIVDAFVSKNLEPRTSSLSGKKLATISFFGFDDFQTSMTYYEGSVLQETREGQSVFVKLKQDPFVELLKSVEE